MKYTVLTHTIEVPLSYRQWAILDEMGGCGALEKDLKSFGAKDVILYDGSRRRIEIACRPDAVNAVTTRLYAMLYGERHVEAKRVMDDCVEWLSRLEQEGRRYLQLHALDFMNVSDLLQVRGLRRLALKKHIDWAVRWAEQWNRIEDDRINASIHWMRA